MPRNVIPKLIPSGLWCLLSFASVLIAAACSSNDRTTTLRTGPDFAVSVAPGYAVTDFATGFDNSGVSGPIGLAFDASGNLFVGDYFTGFLYKFGPGGGVASTATQVNATPIAGSPAGLAFTKDGSLFLARQSGNDLVQLDPSAGTIVRTVAAITFATGLATDPLSGDLFVSNDNQIFRVSHFAQGPGTVTTYASIAADGIAFGADGTLFAAIPFPCCAVAEITGTNSPTPGAVSIINTPFGGVDGMALSANPGTPFLYVNRNGGVITKIDLTTTPPTFTDIFTGGSRGDFAAVGFDGCLYATQTDRVIKVTNADGTCLPPPLGPLVPTSPPPALTVSVDIKPTSCPNPFKPAAAGVLPVAILGTASFDVTTVDPSSVKLHGVSPLRSTLDDVATPFAGTPVNATDCTTAGPDGFTDLVLFFDDQAVAATLGTLTNGQVLSVPLTGNLRPQFGGTPLTGHDVVVVRQ